MTNLLVEKMKISTNKYKIQTFSSTKFCNKKTSYLNKMNKNKIIINPILTYLFNNCKIKTKTKSNKTVKKLSSNLNPFNKHNNRNHSKSARLIIDR